MTGRRTQTMHRPIRFWIVFFCLALSCPQLGSAQSDTWDAFERGGDRVDLKDRLMEHRASEAAAKSRSAAAAHRFLMAMTPNQALYDVLSYDLNFDFTVVPSLYQLHGRTGIRVQALVDSLTTVDLDFSNNMWVSGVTVAGNPVAFIHSLDLLTVILDVMAFSGEIIEIEVTYAGNPAGPSFGWDTHAGEDMIWTLSEPYGAREWWPCKDVNTDKADSLDIRITVEPNLIAASQGVLISNIYNGSTRTFHWRTRYPTNTYQVSLAIHPYTFYTDSYIPLGGGIPMDVEFYVFPDHYASVQANYAKTVPMMEAFAQEFGEYPFVNEKYGHAEFLGGAGMEHQTLSSLGIWTEDVIAHELAHQWFGNYVTCADFKHVWLNEGLATWCEAFWKEKTGGMDAYHSYMDAAGYHGPGTIFVEDPVDFATIFNASLSYNKGAWVVHMLRHVLGDSDFFAGLLAYQAQYAYGSATTEQFRDVMEGVSGKDLDAFFTQWIYGDYYPVYAKEWSQMQTPESTMLDLTIEQVQTNTGLFTMPIDVRVETSTGTFDFTVDNSAAVENYALEVTGNVQDVKLDPDHWIFRRIQDKIESPTLNQGVLLVNGIHWAYEPELTISYQDSAFTGYQPFAFWDVFDAPGGGYPSELPAPLGHGPVPADILGQYSTVIWVSESYLGDVTEWFDTSIYPYLQAGGNVLLMTRRARSFFDDDLTNYLGVSWTQNATTLQNFTAEFPGLTDITFQGVQDWNNLFYPTVGPQSNLLYRDTSHDRGVGVHAQAPGGGSHKLTGGHFALLSGRPYRMDCADLRGNVDFILADIFGEDPNVIGTGEVPAPAVARVLPNYPNPFTSQTTIPLALDSASPVKLTIYDVNGRRLTTLVDGTLPAGSLHVIWDGRDDRGNAVSSGIYYVRLEAGDQTDVRSMVLTR